MRKTLSIALACLAIGLVIVAVIAVTSTTKDAEAFVIDYDDINPSSGGDVIASPGGCAGPPAPCTQSAAVHDI